MCWCFPRHIWWLVVLCVCLVYDPSPTIGFVKPLLHPSGLTCGIHSLLIVEQGITCWTQVGKYSGIWPGRNHGIMSQVIETAVHSLSRWFYALKTDAFPLVERYHGIDGWISPTWLTCLASDSRWAWHLSTLAGDARHLWWGATAGPPVTTRGEPSASTGGLGGRLAWHGGSMVTHIHRMILSEWAKLWAEWAILISAPNWSSEICSKLIPCYEHCHVWVKDMKYDLQNLSIHRQLAMNSSSLSSNSPSNSPSIIHSNHS